VLEHYNFVSMDTEFPGIVFHKDLSKNESSYSIVRKNVESMKLIQVGITLSDADGNLPDEITTWQFNLCFDKNKDLCSEESICLLENAGIDFEKFNRLGISHEAFAESLIPSGLILNENINWVTFHGIYDFAYLLRLVSNLSLPTEEGPFYAMLETYFPNYYDTRQLINNFSWLKGSLNKIAGDLDVQRIGAVHQAGSDSLITAKLFYRIAEQFPEIDFSVERNKLYGLGNDIGGFKPIVNTNVPLSVGKSQVYYGNVENAYHSKFNSSGGMHHHHTSNSAGHASHLYQQTYYNNHFNPYNSKQIYPANNNPYYPHGNNGMMYYNVPNYIMSNSPNKNKCTIKVSSLIMVTV